MAARIDDNYMTAEFGGRVIATARYSSHAATDGQGEWIVVGLPGRLFSRNQAITAMVLAERLAAGYGDNDPFLIGCRQVRTQRSVASAFPREVIAVAVRWYLSPARGSGRSSSFLGERRPRLSIQS